VSDYDNDGRSRPGDFAMDGPLPSGATEPVDVVQVRADDALIAALGRADDPHIDDPIDDRLAGLLRNWRDDVHSEPERPLVDVAAAHAALASAPRPRRRQNPIGPWATAAAVLVVAFVGMGLAAKGAEPGDPLWNVTKVLYSEKAKSVEAAISIRGKLDQAKEALHSGRVNEAKEALQEVQDKLPAVAVEDGQQALADRTEELMDELVGTAPAPTQPTPPPGASSTSSLPTAPSTSDSAVATTSVEAPAPSTTATTAPPGGSPSNPTPTSDPGPGAAPGSGEESARSGTSGTSGTGESGVEQ
jgi:hypothetical protein